MKGNSREFRVGDARGYPTFEGGNPEVLQKLLEKSEEWYASIAEEDRQHLPWVGQLLLVSHFDSAMLPSFRFRWRSIFATFRFRR